MAFISSLSNVLYLFPFFLADHVYSSVLFLQIDKLQTVVKPGQTYFYSGLEGHFKLLDRAEREHPHISSYHSWFPGELDWRFFFPIFAFVNGNGCAAIFIGGILAILQVIAAFVDCNAGAVVAPILVCLTLKYESNKQGSGIKIKLSANRVAIRDSSMRWILKQVSVCSLSVHHFSKCMLTLWY